MSPTTALVVLGGQRQVQVLGPGGQTYIFNLEPQTTGGGAAPTPGGIGGAEQVLTGESGGWRGTMVDLLGGGFSTAPAGGDTPGGTAAKDTAPAIWSGYRYELRADVPRRFKTQVVSPDNDATEEDCAQRFIVSSREIVAALAAKVKVQAKEQDIFSHQIELRFVNAEMDPDQAAREANKVLQRDGIFDARELRFALLRKLAATLREMGLNDEAEDAEKLRHMLNVILTGHPELLYEAQKEALCAHVEIEEADEEIPPMLESESPLTTSRLNVYRRIPPGLNTWERDFAALLDADAAGVVNWWHRNPPRQPWSVQVVLANGHGFFPDFVIGVNGRKKELGALLADPKFHFEITAELPKSHAEHPLYGRVLILARQAAAQWITVRYDAAQKRALLDKEFRLSDAAGF